MGGVDRGGVAVDAGLFRQIQSFVDHRPFTGCRVAVYCIDRPRYAAEKLRPYFSVVIIGRSRGSHLPLFRNGRQLGFQENDLPSAEIKDFIPGLVTAGVPPRKISAAAV